MIDIHTFQSYFDNTFFHHILVPPGLDPDVAEVFTLAIEANPHSFGTTITIHPNDDMYGAPAEHYQWIFWAREDLTAWLREQFDKAVAVVAADAGI